MMRGTGRVCVCAVLRLLAFRRAFALRADWTVEIVNVASVTMAANIAMLVLGIIAIPSGVTILLWPGPLAKFVTAGWRDLWD